MCLPRRQRPKRHNKGKLPNLRIQNNQESIVDAFGDPCPDDELDDEESPGGDGEEIGFEGVEF